MCVYGWPPDSHGLAPRFTDSSADWIKHTRKLALLLGYLVLSMSPSGILSNISHSLYCPSALCGSLAILWLFPLRRVALPPHVAPFPSSDLSPQIPPRSARDGLDCPKNEVRQLYSVLIPCQRMYLTARSIIPYCGGSHRHPYPVREFSFVYAYEISVVGTVAPIPNATPDTRL